MASLRPASYATAKLLFAALIGAAQGAWMTLFVKLLCDFPGHWLPQLAVLTATGASMSIVCLGLSALLTSPDKASLLSIYLVGFQLPLSGVVLALPSALVWTVRPFIATYWGWSGYLTAMSDTRFYDAVVMLDKGWLAPPPHRRGRPRRPRPRRCHPRLLGLSPPTLAITLPPPSPPPSHLFIFFSSLNSN
ncbi:hypothetical protein Ga0100230_020950 [Opitutaceae bacterium TAV3]|nr:hypothetical protein Ga0100230_020950 [Opitutaceae bacterium TAV3]